MTLNEAAAALGLSPGTLRVQVHKGKLKAKKVGPVWTVTPGEVERYRAESLGKRLWRGPKAGDLYGGIFRLPDDS